jgi:electron transfer flavoprotein alpha subunit
VSEPEHRGVWILAEQSAGRILTTAHELLTRGRALADKLNTDLTAVVLGSNINSSDLEELIERGADRVLTIESLELEHFLVEPYAACMANLISERRPEIVIAAASTTGRTLMPYVAVKVAAGLTADCTELDVEGDTRGLLQTRPAIGGNILATIKTPKHRPQMATVRPRSTAPARRQPGRTGQIERTDPPDGLLETRVRRVGFDPITDEHPLQDADLVVAAGRGIKKGQNVPLIESLADALDAALGASRDVVDRGWLSYPHQIGLSGKTITPRLYLGVGVSGSIQHLAGMQTSETIVAINNDPDAQIFQVADFGIVADLFDVVPVLTEKIREAKMGDTKDAAT